MEKKNMVLLTVIAVATLLVAVVGATFAYFTATVQDEYSSSSNQGQADVTAGSVASSTVVGTVDGEAGSFTATGVYPGHKEVAAIKLTADNQEIAKETETAVSFVYTVEENGFQEGELKVSLYRSDKQLNLGSSNNYFQCAHASIAGDSDNEKKFYETCTKISGDNEDTETDDSAQILEALKQANQEANVTKIGTPQNIPTSNNVIIGTDKITAAASSKTEVYYYVVVEFLNTGADQNASMNAKLDGNISVIPA